MIRGGGDLATGVAARLHRSGFDLIITEMAQPRAVRRLVALAEAVYRGRVVIEGLIGKLEPSLSSAMDCLATGVIPVIVDPEAKLLDDLKPLALVDARMRRKCNGAKRYTEAVDACASLCEANAIIDN